MALQMTLSDLQSISAIDSIDIIALISAIDGIHYLVQLCLFRRPTIVCDVVDVYRKLSNARVRIEQS